MVGVTVTLVCHQYAEVDVQVPADYRSRPSAEVERLLTAAALAELDASGGHQWVTSVAGMVAEAFHPTGEPVRETPNSAKGRSR